MRPPLPNSGMESTNIPTPLPASTRSSSRAQVVHAEGTWSFWAPEMCGARGEGVAFNAYAADAWAAGVTLWCFLYGTVPFFRSAPSQELKLLVGTRKELLLLSKADTAHHVGVKAPCQSQLPSIPLD